MASGHQYIRYLQAVYIIFHLNLYLVMLRFNMSTSKWCSICITRRLKLIGTRCFHCLWIYVLSWQERVKPSKKRSRSWEKDLCMHSLGASVWQIYLQADIVSNAFWHDDVLGRQVEAPVPGEQLDIKYRYFQVAKQFSPIIAPSAKLVIRNAWC